MMGLEGVTAAPGHTQPVPRATGVLSQGYLERTRLPDKAAPTEMKRPFSPRLFSLPACACKGGGTLCSPPARCYLSRASTSPSCKQPLQPPPAPPAEISHSSAERLKNPAALLQGVCLTQEKVQRAMDITPGRSRQP